MTRVWQQKKQTLTQTLQDYAQRSPVLTIASRRDLGHEWRAIVSFDTKTFVKVNGKVQTKGPVVVGIRYNERFMSEAPHPAEIVTVLEPHTIFHPNCAPTGAMCLGHPLPGFPLNLILNQIWAGLTFNMRVVNTVPGQVMNLAAAAFIRARADELPLSHKGLLEEVEQSDRQAIDRLLAGTSGRDGAGPPGA